jgi:hypothetical protein
LNSRPNTLNKALLQVWSAVLPCARPEVDVPLVPLPTSSLRESHQKCPVSIVLALPNVYNELVGLGMQDYPSISRLTGGLMLTKCKECGREVSDKAYVCPHCGAPTHQPAAISSDRLATLLGLVSIVGCLLAVVSSWPYGLYVLLRCVVCGSTAFLAWLSAQMGWGKWAWILGITAVIFNPVVPFAFGRPLWAVLDVACALVLIIWFTQRSRWNHRIHKPPPTY